MLKHIVFFRVRNDLEKTKATIVQALKDKLDNLKNKIPEIIDLETGINISQSAASFDLSLIVLLKDEEDLCIYREHPEHQEVVKYLNEIKKEVVVVDYKL